MKRVLSVMGILSLVLCTIFTTFANSFATESNDISDIVGGVKIVNGVKYELSQEEAQAEYRAEEIARQEQLESEVLTEIDESSTRVLVQTKYLSQTKVVGSNTRISKFFVNDTQNNIKKTITGTTTGSASVTAGVDLGLNLSNAIPDANAKLAITASVSVSKSDSTTVTIKPGYKFYITFTPNYYQIKGQKYLLLTHGQGAWRDFTIKAPKKVSGEWDGTIYYKTVKA